MSNVLSTLKGRVTAASYAAAWWLVCRVPESWGRWVFQQAGEIAWRRQGPGVQMLEANLRRVIGPEPSGKELRALSRAGMHSYARYWFEVFRLPVISAERLVDDMRCIGREGHAAQDARRGPRRGARPAAHGQLGPGRGVDHRLWRAQVHHRGRAAQARVAGPAVLRLQGRARVRGAPRDRRRVAGSGSWPSGCARAGWSACPPTGTSPAAASRSTSSVRRRT